MKSPQRFGFHLVFLNGRNWRILWENLLLHYNPSHQKIRSNSWKSIGAKLLKYTIKKICKYLRKKLISLCSQNFSDKDGEFTGIPLQAIMLGETFVNEDKEYCCSGEFNLPEMFNLLSLFKKFTEKKFDVYFREKNEMDSSKQEVKSCSKYYVQKHMFTTLLHLLSQNEFNGLQLTTIWNRRSGFGTTAKHRVL